MAQAHYHEATVTFTGWFPVDMLRYDTCWPVGGDDALAITHRHDTPCTIRVGKTSPYKHDGQWTIDRWRSFSATLTPTTGRAGRLTRGATTPRHSISCRSGRVGSEPTCRRCELPGDQCTCEPAGDFA